MQREKFGNISAKSGRCYFCVREYLAITVFVVYGLVRLAYVRTENYDYYARICCQLDDENKIDKERALHLKYPAKLTYSDVAPVFAVSYKKLTHQISSKIHLRSILNNTINKLLITFSVLSLIDKIKHYKNFYSPVGILILTACRQMSLIFMNISEPITSGRELNNAGKKFGFELGEQEVLFNNI